MNIYKKVIILWILLGNYIIWNEKILNISKFWREIELWKKISVKNKWKIPEKWKIKNFLLILFLNCSNYLL
jgi:hypothetical protein